MSNLSSTKSRSIYGASASSQNSFTNGTSLTQGNNSSSSLYNSSASKTRRDSTAPLIHTPPIPSPSTSSTQSSRTYSVS